MKKRLKNAVISMSFAAMLSFSPSTANAAQGANQVPYRYAVAGANTNPQYVPVVTRRRRRVVRRRRHPYTRHYVVRRRSRKKSAAIVGGSAAAGAGIGALAGGGKGAAIGAGAGGAAGLIYDRKTHKKVVPR